MKILCLSFSACLEWREVSSSTASFKSLFLSLSRATLVARSVPNFVKAPKFCYECPLIFSVFQGRQHEHEDACCAEDAVGLIREFFDLFVTTPDGG
jgi:hypothetical protein